MHPSLSTAVKQSSTKETPGCISSPSAASSGYGSSAEDESAISPYNRLSKQSPFEFSQDFEQIPKSALNDFDALCLLSEPFLDEPRDGLALANEPSRNFVDGFSDEVFEIKPEEDKETMFPWQDDVVCQIEKSEPEASPFFEVTNANMSPSYVDFFTEFFSECGGEVCELRETQSCIEGINSQGSTLFNVSLSNPTEYSSTESVATTTAVDVNVATTEERSHVGDTTHAASTLSDLNEIDDMFNFVFDADDSQPPPSSHLVENCSRQKLLIIDSLEYSYVAHKPELSYEFHQTTDLGQGDGTPSSSPTQVCEVPLARHLGESRNRLKRQNTLENHNPSKSRKQESLRVEDAVATTSSSDANFTFHSMFDSISVKEDESDADCLSLVQDNEMPSDCQVTKDTFLSNFTFQMNGTDAEDAAGNTFDTAADDFKLFFNTPLDVGEIFSNLQFGDMQNEVASDETTMENEAAHSTQNPSPANLQQPNCSYYIIAVPTSLNSNSVPNCIVVKPSLSPKPELGSASIVKVEPMLIHSNHESRHSTSLLTFNQESMKLNSKDKGKVLQTILTCGAIRLNANQGSDAIYEDIIRGHLTTTTAESSKQQQQQQCKLYSSSVNNQYISNLQAKSFKSGPNTGSVRGSNILHRLLKGQLHERDIIPKRPQPSSTSLSSRQMPR